MIELLAVIVILAIIALIAVPIILNIIEDLNKSVTEQSMANLERAAKLYYENKELTSRFNEITFMCKDGKCTSELEELDVKGKVPERGTINIDKDGNITFNSIFLNGYSCTKENKFICKKIEKLKEMSSDGIITLKEANPNIDINYKIYGNSIQEGTPTPDSPKEIKSVGDLVTDINNPNYGKYEIKIKVVGKNLFDIEEYVNNANEMGANGTISLIENGILQKTIGYQQDKSKMKIKLKSNTQYTFSSDVEWLSSDELARTGFKIYYVSGDVNQINAVPSTEKINFKTLKNDTISFISSGGWSYNGVVKFSNIQLEEGTEKTEYEPYSGRKYSIYLDEPLRCVDEVCDYIDFESSKVVRNVKELVVKSDFSFSIWNESITENSMGVYYADANILGIYNNPKFVNIGLSNYFVKGPTVNTKNDNLIGKMICNIKSQPPYIAFKVPFTNYDNWINYIKEKESNPIIVLYELKDKIEEEIELPNIKLNKDVTNIIIDTEINPSKLELEYYK